MRRQDFMFTIGYQGNAAIIDGKARSRYASLSLQELLEKGLFKTAFCAALYDQDEEAQKMVLNTYNQQSKVQYPGVEVFKKVIGVYKVPEGIQKTIVV